MYIFKKILLTVFFIFTAIGFLLAVAIIDPSKKTFMKALNEILKG